MTNNRRARRPLFRLEKLDDRINPVAFQVKSTNYLDANGLKAALVAVNASADPTNTITFLPGLTGTIALGVDMEKIVKSVDIQGPGANVLTIDGGGTKRLFNLDDGSDNSIDVVISGLTINNGKSPDDGGGVRSKNEIVTLNQVTLTNNQATSQGGAIAAFGGTFAVVNTLVGTPGNGNTSVNGGGGGIANNGATFSFAGSRIEDNSAPATGTGGYFQLTNGNVQDMVNTAVVGNFGVTTGGMNLSGVTANLTNVLIADNVSQSSAGGLRVEGGTVTLKNVTVSGNKADVNGGGIFYDGGVLEIRNSTIALNAADADDSGTGDGGGLFATAGSVAKVFSSIIAKNTEKVAAPTQSDAKAELNAASAFNLIGVNTDVTGVTNATQGNLIGTAGTPRDPLLAPLAFNGGLFQTHAIASASPAKDVGDVTGLGLTTDARGEPFARVVGTKADMGAYELPAAPISLQVTTTADEDDATFSAASMSLREALKFAGTDAPTVTFAAALSGQTITLTRGQLLINRPLTVTGPGAADLTVSGGSQFRVLRVDDGLGTATNVAIGGLTITGGKSPTGTDGGGMLTFENVTLDGVRVTGNEAGDDGGGINHVDGDLTVRNSTISGNKSNDLGGGIRNQSGATVSVVNSTISGNKAGSTGGGIDNAGTGIVVVSNSTISDNQAVTNGGGVNSSSGTLVVNNSTVAFNAAGSDNTAAGKGGGLSITGGTAKFTGSIIAKNTFGTFAGSGSPDIQGAAVGKFSLVFNQTGWTQSAGTAGIVAPNQDPLLGPLQDNGGPTFTRALPAAGPATDPGFAAADVNPDTLTTDQRGRNRLSGTTIDLGAFEFSPNTPPTITPITDPSAVATGTVIGPLNFTVGDAETAAAALTVTATSGNTTLIPNANIATGGTGATRTITLTPAAGQTGTAVITVTVNDGNATTSTTFTATVTANTPPTITPIGNPAAITVGNIFPLINFTVGDAETAAGALTVTATSSNATLVPNSAANLTLGGAGTANRTLLVSPAPGQTGTSTITVTVSDGTLSTNTTFTVTVNPAGANTAPTITAIANPPAVTPGTVVGPLAFTVNDAETAAAALTVTAASGNTTLVPAGGIVLGGAGANRTITVTPAAGQTGTAVITVTVSDGALSTNTTFTVTVNATGGTPNPLLVGVPQFGVGLGAGTAATAQFFNPDKTQRFSTTAFAGFTGGVRVASGDFNGDGVPDLVVGTGPGQATQVRILDGVTQAQLFSVQPFEASFAGGVYVAVGDVDGDGKADLVITPDEGGGPRVDIYSGATGNAKIASFFGIADPNFRGGARAAVADFNGDNVADVVVAAGFGGGPRVAVFNGTTVSGANPTRLFGDFFVFEEGLRNGAFVAAGDFDGDGKADLVAGGGPGGGPRVTVFNGASLLTNQYVPLANFFAGDTSNRGGIRVAVKNLDADNRADLVVGSGTGGGSRVTAFAGKTISNAPPELFAFDAQAGFSGGVFVG